MSRNSLKSSLLVTVSIRRCFRLPMEKISSVIRCSLRTRRLRHSVGWCSSNCPKARPTRRSTVLFFISIILLMTGFLVATMSGLLLARRMIDPIQKSRIGAMRIGGGDLGHRISIKSNDELEALGEQFNSMAGQLEESYATLERKVAERTHDLEYANAAKSRFLAMASHDLRQPLHALGLFVAHLPMPLKPRASAKTIERVDAAVREMTEMFNAL